MFGAWDFVHARHSTCSVDLRKMTQATIERTVASASARVSVELPTLVLVLTDYAGWLLVTLAYRRWPVAVVAVAGTLLVTLHSSLQHEIVHGHPTRWFGFNRLLGMIPLTLWLPFERYRRTHRLHHNDARLTDPLDDPESYYLTPEAWANLGPLARGFLRVEHTLAGRVVIGSVWRIVRFLRLEFLAVIRNEPGLRLLWLEHLAWCIPVVLWLEWVCGVPLWFYFVAMVIPANGIQLIRSFAEHRARPGACERIAIVEKSWILGPLFLFNNLHSLHHEAPAIPWYQYIARYRMIRERLLAENGGLVYNTYFDVARRFLFRPHDDLPHPRDRR
jgi:fatty acid desaturase